MIHKRSRELQRQSEALIPGGVNSPVRAFVAVGGDPVWFERGEGAWLYDVDGNRYLDFVGSWGPLILGHAPAAVVAAICGAAAEGTSFGASSPRELELARMVCDMHPAIEMLRFVNSGTEATMSAIRLARAFTGRELIVKFEGGYHGHADMLLAKAGSGVATLGIPGSAGVPESATRSTLVLPYNDVAVVGETFARRGSEIACIIVEPVAGNMGCVPPRPGYLEALRRETKDAGALLIFDEVITGFRLARGGAAECLGIRPDLVTLGKIVGGGLPVGAYGGRRDIMERVAPLGPVYQAGTLSGNPLAMAAGIATLGRLDAGLYRALERRTGELVRALAHAARGAGVQVTINSIGSMFTVFFVAGDVHSHADAQRCDTAAFARFHRAMLENGVLLPASQFETAFVSAAHGEPEIEFAARAAAVAFSAASAAV